MEDRQELEREGTSRPLRAVQDGLDDGPRLPERGFDDVGEFEVDAFVDDTDRIEFRPYPGQPPLVMEVRHVISRGMLKQHNRDLREIRQDTLRLEHLEDRLAKLDDERSQEYEELEREIAELKGQPDDLDLEIEQIIIPTVVWWNLKAGGKPIPIEREAIRALPMKLHAGIVKTIVDWAMGLTQGKKRKTAKTKRTSSHGSRTRR
jgi:hypothetical protein